MGLRFLSVAKCKCSGSVLRATWLPRFADKVIGKYTRELARLGSCEAVCGRGNQEDRARDEPPATGYLRLGPLAERRPIGRGLKAVSPRKH